MEPLVNVALVGTAQQGTGPVTTGAPVDGLVAQRVSSAVERGILLQAGALSVYRMAGALPLRDVAALEPAPDESLPACSSAAADLVRSLLSGTHSSLLPEALERLRLARLRLPFDLLPLALSARENRDALAPVLGERGRWLSGFNPAWSWARAATNDGAAVVPDDAETIWLEGAASQRVAVLRCMRASDPARAREWLAGVWQREKAELRAALLAALEIRLTPADEAFLEAALEDRATAVRERAALLLAELPDSALARRLAERADALVSYIGGALKVKPPLEFAKAATRDGLVDNTAESRGQRARWISLYLSRVPLSHWNERFGTAPDKLIADAVRSEWSWPLLEGWSQAFLFHGSSSWLMPLWQAWVALSSRDVQTRKDQRAEICKKLAPHLPERELERAAVDMLVGQQSDLAIAVDDIVGVLPRPWSADLGQTYIEGLRRFVETLTPRTTSFGPWDGTLEVAALALPPGCFSAALEPYTLPEGTGWHLTQFSHRLDMFAGALRWRQRLIEEIPL